MVFSTLRSSLQQGTIALNDSKQIHTKSQSLNRPDPKMRYSFQYGKLKDYAIFMTIII